MSSQIIPLKSRGDLRETSRILATHTVADDKCEGHQRHQQPEAVEGNGQGNAAPALLLGGVENSTAIQAG
jgi:hypothetical protein